MVAVKYFLTQYRQKLSTSITILELLVTEITQKNDKHYQPLVCFRPHNLTTFLIKPHRATATT